jgi:hypothetical protein
VVGAVRPRGRGAELYVGWLLTFWATPRMPSAHLVFAATLTAYILAAIRWEERDLTGGHSEYAAYRRRVPMLIPRWPSSSSTVAWPKSEAVDRIVSLKKHAGPIPPVRRDET